MKALSNIRLQPHHRGFFAIMNPQPGVIAAWDFSRWFVVLSPLIGVLLGFLGAFIVLH
jgi:hypothetical protein